MTPATCCQAVAAPALAKRLLGLRAELQRTGQSRAFLEVFSGSSGLSRAVKSEGEAALSIDVLFGEHHDVLEPDVLRLFVSG